MEGIQNVIPVLPIALVSAVMIESDGREMKPFEVKAAVDKLLDDLWSNGATIYYPKKNFDKYIDVALEMMKIRHMVIESDGQLMANQQMTDILTYYANSISHWR